MSIVAPCITVETAEQYKEAVERLAPFAERVHIDISDGEFAPIFLVGAAQIWWPKEWIVDVHCMVKRPSEHLETLIALKPSMITVHAEIDEDVVPVLNYIKRFDIKAGLGLLRPTVPETVKDAILAADHVMVFSGDLGKYGGVASMMQLEKVRLIKNINAEVEIGWDGGVSIDNAFSLAQGGVDVLNSGGAINKSADPADAYAKLVIEINKHGVI